MTTSAEGILEDFEEHKKSLQVILDFLKLNPDRISNGRASKNYPKDSEAWWTRWAQKFVKGRELRAINQPKTKSDNMVSELLLSYFDLEAKDLEVALQNHRNAMSAENAIGGLLEAYLAVHLEKKGWVWCSGETVKAIDFLLVLPNGQFRTLQVKNRSNTENSSSSAIRNGTDIEKWHRMDANTGALKWDKFPDESIQGEISEDGFKEFVRAYIQEFKPAALA
jgi:hypothetical protein